MLKKHYNYEPGASAMLYGHNDGASVTDIQCRIDKNGEPVTVITCIGASIGGEAVSITVPGSIAKPTSQDVAAQLGRMVFYRAKFTNLIVEAKAGAYNQLDYVGSADSVEFIAPTPAPGIDNTTKH